MSEFCNQINSRSLQFISAFSLVSDLRSDISIENIDEWLTQDIFVKVIENDLKLTRDQYEFISLESGLATKPGDNYLSVLIRSKITIELHDKQRKSLSYMVKCLLAATLNKEFTEQCEVFPKECRLLSEILPKFEEFYYDVGVSVQFGPKCYYIASEPCQMIIMEDLGDYKMAVRQKGLDQDHIKLCLEWFAKYHAASMVYHERIGNFGEEFNEGLYRENVRVAYEGYFSTFLVHFIEAMKSLPNGEIIVEKVKTWKGRVFELLKKTMSFDENAINVLNHGDAWTNNIMFAYDDDKKLRGVRFVDFQVGYYGTIAQDLYQFMVTSWETKSKVSKFDEFIGLYCGKLQENLKVLKYQGNIPTHADLLSELERRKIFRNY